MKKLLITGIILLGMNELHAQTSATKIIAHRGAWKEFNLPENSIAALEKAIELKVYGSEFDVRRTKDGVLVVNHDPTYFGDTIELNTYETLNSKKLTNGESLPTLASYFEKGTAQKNNTLMICEIKQAIIDPLTDKTATEEVVSLVKKMGIENRVVYISFRFEILQWIKALNPKAIVLYLETDKSISTIKHSHFDGINYHYSAYASDPSISAAAKESGLLRASWTVNKIEDLKLLQEQGVTLITTNHPNEFLKYVSNQ